MTQYQGNVPRSKIWFKSTANAAAETGSSWGGAGECGPSSPRGGRGLVGRLIEGEAGKEGEGTTGDGLEAKTRDVLGETTARGGEEGVGESERDLLVSRTESGPRWLIPDGLEGDSRLMMGVEGGSTSRAEESVSSAAVRAGG